MALTEELRQHIRDCPRCVVDDDGGYYLCDRGAAIRQRVNKERYFGRREPYRLLPVVRPPRWERA